MGKKAPLGANIASNSKRGGRGCCFFMMLIKIVHFLKGLGLLV